jgi:hypothetical protein
VSRLALRAYAARSVTPLPIRAATNRLFLALLVVIVLGVWIPFDLFSEFEHGTFTAGAALCTAILVFVVGRLASLAFWGQPQLLAITFYLFIYVWIGIAGTIQIYTSEFSWPTAHRDDDVLAGLLIIVMAIACYEAGRLFARVQVRRPHPANPPEIRFEISAGKVMLIAAFAVPAAIYGALYFGGLGALFSTRATFTSQVADWTKMGGLLARALLRTPSFVALMLAIIYGLRNWGRMRTQGKRIFLSLLAALVVLNVFTNFPTVQARYWLGTITLTPLFAFLPWKQKYAAGWIIALAITLMSIYPRADIFRRAATFDQAITALQQRGSIAERVFTGDYDVLQQTINTYVYYDLHGSMYGRNIIGAALFFFPRQLWSGKPYGTGATVAAALGYRYTNLSEPLWAEFFIAFGWVGLALLMGAYGLASAKAEQAFEAANASGVAATVAGVAVPFWAAFQFFLLRGDLQVAASHALFVVALFVLAARWVVRRKRVEVVQRSDPQGG